MASSITDFFSQGAEVYNQSGIDPFALISKFYDTVEIRTNAAPPLTLNIGELGGAPSPYTKYLQPTLIFSGSAGRYAWAPYGEADPNTGTFVSVGSLLALGGLGFLLGRLTKRK